jgi:uncharacterized protein (DUF433 family)
VTVPSDVCKDEHGVYRVGESRVSIDSLVFAFKQGHSAETIQQQYPALQLADVYAAIAFYLRNRNEVEQYLKSQAALWSHLRDEWNARSGTLVQRLRDSRQNAMVETP